MKSKEKKLLVVAAVAVGAFFLFNKKSDAAEVTDQYGFEPPPPPPIEVSAQAFPLQSALAVENRKNLIRYSLTNTAWINAFNKMNDAEIMDAWEYMWSFLLKNRKLYRDPGATGFYPDGAYNPQLYDAIAAIKLKYKIF